jgi:hypothetical protein
LIIIDGLDEISQRSAYETIQRRLRAVFEMELEHTRDNARRFIISCRMDDDIGVFSVVDAIQLQGLGSERERERFCTNLIWNAKLSRNTQAAVKAALSTGARALTSSDVFRRNPYFLTLLIEYYTARDQRPIDPQIDFARLMEDYIAREADRGHAGASSAARITDPRAMSMRRQLRAQLEPIATLTLQQVAYTMTTSRRVDALYGKANLDGMFVSAFLEANHRASSSEDPSTLWGTIARFVELLSSNREFSSEEKANLTYDGFLHESDVESISAAFALAKSTDNFISNEVVMKSLGTIPHREDVEDITWYEKLGLEISKAFNNLPIDRTPQNVVAVLLFARGIAAAHALRLLYIEALDSESPGDGMTVRFRHRRLAEYFAAGYYRARWDEIALTEDSPWLTPVLYLVCAIEGEDASAFHFLVSLVGSLPERERFIWRARMFAAVEAAAFASRGSRQIELVDELVRMLVASLEDLAERHAEHLTPDTVTRISVIQALDFLGRLHAAATPLPKSTLDILEQAEIPQSSTYLVSSGKAVRALELLTGRWRSAKFRSVSLGKSLVAPEVIITSVRDVFASKLGLEWAASVLLVITGEVLLAIGIWLTTQWALSHVSIDLIGENDPLQSTPVWLATLVVINRLRTWISSPISASQMMARPMKFAFRLLAWCSRLAVRCFTALWRAPKIVSAILRDAVTQIGRQGPATIALLFEYFVGMFVRFRSAATRAPRRHVHQDTKRHY